MRNRRLRKYSMWTKKHGRKKPARPSSRGHLEISSKPKVAVVETQAEQSIVPYDENLLERSRTQWQFGDWLPLAQLNRETLQHHPDRAKLALLAAAGRLQTCKNEEAKQFIRLAQGWGAGKKLIYQILISGVHNSLGRAALIDNQQLRALPHFENAIAIGTPGSEVRLLTQARIISQKEQIFDLFQKISIGVSRNFEVTIFNNDSSHTRIDSKRYFPIKWKDDHINIEMEKIPKEDFVDVSFDLSNQNETEGLFIIFSTPRCGSTMVCELLMRNDMCLAHEYFQPYQYMPILAKRWDCIVQNKLDASKYITELCRHRTLPNGWLGVNMHASHIPVFVTIKHYFSHLNHIRYIKIQRKDVIAQAVSFAIAKQTNKWSTNFEQLSEPVYDFQQIRSLYKILLDENALIDSFVRKHKLECDCFYYEDLTNDPSGFLSSIKSHIPNTKPLVTCTQIKRQTDPINDAWVSRFEEDIFNHQKRNATGFIELN